MEHREHQRLQLVGAALVGAMSCVAPGQAMATPMTYVQRQCEGVPYSETILLDGSTAASSCAHSGAFELGATTIGTHSTSSTGTAGFTQGDWGARVDYRHLVETGIGIGPVAYAEVGATDYLIASNSALQGVSFAGTVLRSHGGGAEPGLAYGSQFSFSLSLRNSVTGQEDICELFDSGACSVSISALSGEQIRYTWAGFGLAAASGSGYPGTGFAFEEGIFRLDAPRFLDGSGGSIADPTVLSESGATYPVAVAAPVPEPESWMLLAAGWAGIGFMTRRRRSSP